MNAGKHWKSLWVFEIVGVMNKIQGVGEGKPGRKINKVFIIVTCEEITQIITHNKAPSKEYT